MADYRVNLDVFSGPMDLLLYLIRKDEVDIYDVDLTSTVDQYLKYIDMLNNLDMDLAGEFLVMASTLIEIKSAMLLPKADPDSVDADDLTDPRAELIRQLLEYKKYKDAAGLLEANAQQQQQKFGRPDTIIDKLKPTAEPQLDMDRVSVWDLLEAFDTIVRATGGAIDYSHIKDDTPIDLYQIEILHRLQTEGPMNFERIFEAKTKKIEMVGLFLALLELARERLISLEQPSNLSSIYLKATTEVPAEKAVNDAIIATEEELRKQAEALNQKPKIPIVEIQDDSPQTTEESSEVVEFKSEDFEV